LALISGSRFPYGGSVSSHAKATLFQFGPFELDPTQQELRRKGVRLRLPGSRLRLLHLLVSRSGDLISRDEIASILWKDTHTIDVVSGINTAVNQLRAQLGDDPASPRYIETVIGAGYRFIADVVAVEPPTESAAEPAVIHALPVPTAIPTAIPEVDPLQPVTAAAPASPDRKLTGRPRWISIALASAVVLAAVYGVVRFSAARAPAPPPEAELEMIRVTGDGDIQYADIAPNGKYVAYIRAQGGQQGLWLKQLATSRVLKLADMGAFECQGIAFSPDSDYVYFMRKAPLAPSGELYRVPFLGGTPTQILTGISGPPAISPDGLRIAFVRSTLVTHGQDSIVTASIDGAGEQVLSSFPAPGIHMNRITWSGDGSSLVFPLQSTLYSIPTDGGTARPVPTSSPWKSIDDLRYLPSNGNLLIVGTLSGLAHAQIYEMTWPEGRIQALTHDMSNYIAIRATSDGKSLVAVQDLVLDSIQLIGPGKEAQTHALSAENQNRDGIEALAWTRDGRLIYSSRVENRSELLETSKDGSPSQRIVTTNGDYEISDLAVTPHGDYLAETRWRLNDVANIWRTDLTGGGEKQLTTGKQDFPLSLTPDGSWIVYSSAEGDRSVLMKVPIEGGQPLQLTSYSADDPSVSFDGRWIACSYTPNRDQPQRLAIVPFSGGPPARVFNLPRNGTLRYLAWMPDSQGVAFIQHGTDADNILEQPLAGGAAIPITHFASGSIFNFEASRDGRIAMARGTESVDAILIKNFHGAGRP
jgi:Tol biopolymer transport system component/DNA-binding winged helix-turn-helix (wHTH) protein